VAVVGVDGRRDGWIAAVRRDESITVHRWEMVEDWRRVAVAVAVAVVVDVALGLSATGERRCEPWRAANCTVEPARSSTPPRVRTWRPSRTTPRTNEISILPNAKVLS
jgi:predicted RNase H-like nuclease